MSAIHIANFACMVVAGTDARRFAQLQLAGNVEHLAPGHWQWNAWLTAQGKVRLLLHLADPGDGRLVALARGGNASEACAALGRYLLRADATLATHVWPGYANGPLAMGSVRTAADAIILGYGDRSLELRWSEVTDGGGVDPAVTLPWRLAEIRAGWPSLPKAGVDWWPPALGLEHLGAVAFDKGCYPGQEVVARLHYRGGHKLRLYHLHGAVGLPTGSLHDGTGAVLEVLDCVADNGGFACLVIAQDTCASDISILDNSYKVVSKFDA